MGYLHIDNLYKDRRILEFRRCFALEKVHGTSAHVGWDGEVVRFFAGGEKHDRFVKLFGDTPALADRFRSLTPDAVVVYGEAYGGSQQGMKATYGDDLRFIVFDVLIGESWLSVPDAAQVAASLGLEFVPFTEGPTDLEWIDAQRDAPSEVAVRRGIAEPRKREGVVLRPPFEVTLNNGARVIAKHKADEFSERATPPKVVDAAKLALLDAADKIAAEWVVEERLTHVLGQLTADGVPPGIERTGDVIKAMLADVQREAAGEVVWSKDAERAVGKRTAQMFKARLQAVLREGRK